MFVIVMLVLMRAAARFTRFGLGLMIRRQIKAGFAPVDQQSVSSAHEALCFCQAKSDAAADQSSQMSRMFQTQSHVRATHTLVAIEAADHIHVMPIEGLDADSFG